jgi:hypothetical protein
MGVAAVSGTAAGMAVRAVGMQPALARVESLLEAAQATSSELATVMASWNALDEPGKNAVKMQVRGGPQ